MCVCVCVGGGGVGRGGGACVLKAICQWLKAYESTTCNVIALKATVLK